MAYGLDVEELYYADHQLVDKGILTTYKISLDIADEKEFELETPDFVMEADDFWYVPNTELGGIIDAYETNSEDGIVKYRGRSFRGILNSKIVPTGISSRMVQGDITDVVNEIITDCDLDDFVVCDAPDIYEDISTDVNGYTIPFGSKMYETITGIAASIGLNLVYTYSPNDKMLHAVPILQQDYTDYLMYSNVAGTYFTIDKNDNVTNHLIIIGEDDETKERRMIHLFADDGGQFQPFATVDVQISEAGGNETFVYKDSHNELQPVDDSMYILDQRNKIMHGVDEIAEVVEVALAVATKYKKLFERPKNWNTKFGEYFKLVQEKQDGEIVSESFDNYEATENPPTYSLVTQKPSNWNTNYSSYFTRYWNQETQQYDYSAVYAETELDYSAVIAQKKQPIDWKYRYDEYYYYMQPATHEQLTQYSGVSRTMFIKLKSKPLDWNNNYSSYYKKAFTEVQLKKKSKKKRAELIKDCTKYKDAYYKAVSLPKGKKTVKFEKNKYYRAESYTVAPAFKKNNTFHVPTKVIVPTWDSTIYYKQNPITYSVPIFEEGKVYKQIEDHYEHLILSGIQEFEDLQKTTSQRMVLEDYEVNIGDIVGGKDEFTGTLIIRAVTNINVTIESGILTMDYEVSN